MKQCVYCGEVKDKEQMLLSEIVPDGTVYPGVQFFCKDTYDCLSAIHEKFHKDVLCPECEFCAKRIGM